MEKPQKTSVFFKHKERPGVSLNKDSHLLKQIGEKKSRRGVSTSSNLALNCRLPFMHEIRDLRFKKLSKKKKKKEIVQLLFSFNGGVLFW